jgi:hypothetical protein
MLFCFRSALDLALMASADTNMESESSILKETNATDQGKISLTVI